MSTARAAASPARCGPSRRVRLGLVANEYSHLVGGMSTVARAMVRYLHRRGYEVHLFVNRRCQPDPQVATFPILTTDLAKDLVRLAPYNMDVWHALNFGYAPLALLKRPFVLTVHGNDFLKPWVRFMMDGYPFWWRLGHQVLSRGPVARTIDALALRCVDQVIAVSRFSAGLLRDRYPFGGPVQVIPNGVEPEFLQETADARHAPPRHPRRLITVAGLDRRSRKNVDGVLRALALVGDRLDLEYLVVGDGPARAAWTALAHELNVAHRVCFLGQVSNAELRQAYRSSSLHVLVPRPVPDDVEGFGIVYLEAAASGTPSLGSRHGGATDAIAEGKSGFFAREATPEGIAEALSRFFTGTVQFDPEAVRAHAQAHAWPEVLQRVERVYAGLVPRGSEGRSPIPSLTLRGELA